ncbi:MAG TPA: ShlB/FhaC/HecB family hemolysin secretion/activation protein [Candidatus Paceibacterota bacterium]
MPQSVHAQSNETPDTLEQRNRTKEEASERERQQKAPRVDLQGEIKPPAELTLPTESPCFKIDRFVLDVPAQLPASTRLLGASAQSGDRFHFAQAYLEQYRGRCIGREGVGLLLSRLTDQILAKGYTTTRLGIPEQDLSSGTLKLTLIPGVIHQLRFADPATTGHLNAFPSGAGELFNLRDFEQGLEQMKRVTSQDVDMQIVPAGTLGESDVVISVKRIKPWKLIASLDDSGTKGTGKLQAGLTLGWDNLFDASDMFTFGTTSDAEQQGQVRGTRGYNTSYSIPFGYWTATVSASDYLYHQQIAGISQTFVSSGDAQNFESKIAYLFYRDQKQKYSVQFRTGKRWSHSYIDDTEVEVQYRNTSFAELALIHKRYLGQSQLDITAAYRWGTPWFGAQSDPADLPDTSPRLNYQVQTVDATLGTAFKAWDIPLTHSVTLRAQNANSPLYASEWFSIGSRWTVRGFDGENTLASEQGFYLRNELAMPFWEGRHNVYIGLDYGKVYGPNVPNLAGNQLAGAVLGLRGSPISNMSYDIFAGVPVSKPDGFRTAEPTAGFSLNYQM